MSGHWWELIGVHKGIAMDIPSEGQKREDYGTPRHSGRYPYGSGDNPYQHEESFMKTITELRKKGMSETDIAKSMDMTTTEYRHRKATAVNDLRAYRTAEVMRLRDKGMSPTAIARRMDMNESSVRTLLSNSEKIKIESARYNADILKKELEKHPYLDVGAGVERQFGITSTKLKNSLDILKKEGYSVETIRVDQATNPNQQTTVTVLARPGTTQSDIWKNQDKIEIPMNYFSEDGERLRPIEPPKSIDSSRIMINYADPNRKDSGELKDGLIELRRGVPDLDLHRAQYAQVRIAVDGTHFIKGMAVYADDLPEGVDIRFNTNKTSDVPMIGPKDNTVLKPMKNDPANPFGADFKAEDKLILAQKHYIDENGKEQLSALNIVSEEGDRAQWSRTLASQFLAKQAPALAKQQLDIKYKIEAEEFNDIQKISNPTVKQRMLEEFADKCDKSASDLDAAPLPGQANKYILPVPSLKDNEIYAPHLKDGTQVVCVRYPHAGIFEIPTLTVNNRNKEAQKMMGTSPLDAVGIGHKAAEQLSGADFDGDSVLVIPVDNVKIKTSEYLPGLRNFNHLDGRYAAYPGMHVFKKGSQTEGLEMGKVSNLITDMTIKGAPLDEIERAVRHSMVVIDTAKHELNYRLSEQIEDIADLQRRYQKAGGGASTLLSRAGAEKEIPERKEKAKRDFTEQDWEDWRSGKKVYTTTGNTKTINRLNKKTGEYEKVQVERMTKVHQMDTVDDAYDLITGTPSRIEKVYADYANNMKDLARKARALSRSTTEIDYSPSAAKVYSTEVSQLKEALHKAQANAPFERKAQIVAKKMASERIYNAEIRDKDKKKKIRAEELKKARDRFGAKKNQIYITDSQWKAIMAGAITKTFLNAILDNANPDRVKELATPRSSRTTLSPSKQARAKSMLARGYTQAEVADMLSVPVSTLTSSIGLYK